MSGFPEGEGQWFNFSAWMAVAFELPFLVVAPPALTPRGSNYVGAEQRRKDREELPPARQETPEHFVQIEGEMREIRERMAPDVRGLRARLNPRTLQGRTKRDTLRDTLARLRTPLSGRWVANEAGPGSVRTARKRPSF